MAEEKKTCESCGQTVQEAWIDPFEHFGKMHSSIMDIWNRLDTKLNGEVEEKEEAKETQEQTSDEQEVSESSLHFLLQVKCDFLRQIA